MRLWAKMGVSVVVCLLSAVAGLAFVDVLSTLYSSLRWGYDPGFSSVGASLVWGFFFLALATEVRVKYPAVKASGSEKAQ